MKDFQASISSGLSTDTYIVPVAGNYKLSAFTTVNTPSGLTVTLSQTGSQTVSVSTTPASSTEIDFNIEYNFFCQVGDVLSCVLTSSAPLDQPPNLIKTIVRVRAGQ